LHWLALPGQIVLLHVVLLAVPPGRVPFKAARHLAVGAAIDALAFRGEAAIAPDLLVVAEAVPAGNLGMIAALGLAGALPAVVLALRSEAAVPPDLLVVAGTVPGRAGQALAALGLAGDLPLVLYDSALHDELSFLTERKRGRVPTKKIGRKLWPHCDGHQSALLWPLFLLSAL
jgi:hypothetical protein